MSDQAVRDRTIVANVCEMPVRFKARGDVSMAQLVRESGVLDTPGALSAAAVRAYLNDHVHLIDAWAGLSEDKRTLLGWYLVERSSTLFEVGCHPDGPRLSFDDRVQACAEFIVRETNAMAAHR